MIISTNLVLLGFSTPVRANDATATMDITAEVVASCTLEATNMDMGDYNLQEINNATATTTATCTTGTTYTLDADGGQNGTVANRQMKLTTGADLLDYNLYTDDQRSTIWGSGNLISGTGDSTGQVYTIYGKVPAGQSASIGDYSDTVTITLDITN